jgi:hypothetical protein
MWSFLKKPEIEQPYDPPIPFLGINLKELKGSIQQRYLHIHV